MTLGLVCDSCDTLSALSATVCVGCGEPLGISIRPPGPLLTPPDAVPAKNPMGTGTALTPSLARAVYSGSAEVLPATVPTNVLPTSGAFPTSNVPQPAAALSARNCTSCGALVGPGQKFCGECGTRLDAGAPVSGAPAPHHTGSAKTLFFSSMQQPGRAKLILIKGEGMDGVSYHLAGAEHVAGRLEGAILFPEDPLLSPRHANFLYKDGKLHVRDEHSHNGVFIRIKGPVILEHGATFLVGEQLLRIEATPADALPQPDAEGTYFYGSPKRSAKMCLVQLLAGGEVGMVFRARSEAISIGRESNDVNFPNDPFISGRHATVTALDGGRFQLADLGSRNGTFLRVRTEAPLFHGDYVFLGQQLLRVEIT